MYSKLALAAAVLGLAASLAYSSEHSSVLDLTSSTYDDAVSDGKVYFIKYFAPWCGHCKRLAPTWAELATAVKGNSNVAIAHVDCTQHKDICQTAQIRGYPTLKVIHQGEEVKAYRGGRDLEALQAFITEVAEELTTETSS